MKRLMIIVLCVAFTCGVIGVSPTLGLVANSDEDANSHGSDAQQPAEVAEPMGSQQEPDDDRDGVTTPDGLSPAQEASPAGCGGIPTEEMALEAYLAANPGVEHSSEEGVHPYRKWLVSNSTQAEVERLNGLLDHEFGSSLPEKLDKGLIGTTVNHLTKKLIVVIDSSLVDIDLLAQQLDHQGISTATTELVSSCSSAESLARAISFLRNDRAFVEDEELTVSFDVDVKSQMLLVSLSPHRQDLADRLLTRFGDVVRMQEAPSDYAGNRLLDKENHFSAAGIRSPSDPYNWCTSAFTVRLDNGNLGSVTARHCFPNHSPMWSGPSIGAKYYGETSRRQALPFDMQVILPKGQQFAKRIWTTGDTGWRYVVAASNANVNQGICLSGLVEKQNCGGIVTSTTYERCNGGTCANFLRFESEPGDRIAQGGDSGAPLYVRTDPGESRIPGMLLGGWANHQAYGHHVGTIRSRLNVAVALY